ncbi:hypothetical protein QA612_19570 [Evansella sp. AB-P1]|uniref:hypothetical protein n=1 Tax=Evansella sp. AB-P1 TaxID=3037653 RepID=UPI00241FAFB0|nr:hypothetical protein [Evansella sp. AB-P1]MDG5789660.1 hypothetical protein [Evansella sp. AB-P1]
MRKILSLTKGVFKFYREHLLILCFILVVIICMILLQFIFGGVDRNFGLLLIPNMIVEMVSILVTAYIIAVLLQKNEEKKAKEKAYRLIGSRYSGLVSKVSTRYVHLITREPYGDPGGLGVDERLVKQITNCLDGLEELVPPDSIDKKIEKLNSLITKLERTGLGENT